jgi:hypothetical protein
MWTSELQKGLLSFALPIGGCNEGYRRQASDVPGRLSKITHKEQFVDASCVGERNIQNLEIIWGNIMRIAMATSFFVFLSLSTANAANPNPYCWCVSVGHNKVPGCYYVTFEQCQAHVFTNAFCVPNPDGCNGKPLNASRMSPQSTTPFDLSKPKPQQRPSAVQAPSPYTVSLQCISDGTINFTSTPDGWSPVGTEVALHHAEIGGLFNGRTTLYCYYNEVGKRFNDTGLAQLGLVQFTLVAPGSCIVAPNKRGFLCKEGTTNSP